MRESHRSLSISAVAPTLFGSEMARVRDSDERQANQTSAQAVVREAARGGSLPFAGFSEPVYS